MLVIKEDITERNKNFEKEWNTYQRKKRNIRVFFIYVARKFFCKCNIYYYLCWFGKRDVGQ